MCDSEIRGRCLCGKVSYVALGAPLWTALCHCESCRRAASAPVVAWMGFSTDDVAWSGERRFYQSSQVARRSFCPECGTQMSFESTRWPGEVHLYGVSRDDPETYRPELHCHTDEQLPWLVIEDGLPRHAGTFEPDGS